MKEFELTWKKQTITWLGVKALFPSRASLSIEVWGGTRGGLEDRSTAGSTTGPITGKVWSAKAQK